MSGGILGAAWVPGLPHVLHPKKSSSWAILHQAYSDLGVRVRELKPDVLVIYSSQWLSVLGTSFQTHPHPQGLHVDENWYGLGDLPFDFKVDTELGEKFAAAVSTAGYPTKTVNFDQFPIDTGSIVLLQFLNPGAQIPVTIVSSWVYADAKASRTIGATMRDVTLKSGKRAVFVASSLLSCRYFTTEIDPQADRISQKEDDVWNQKILGALESGDFERVSQYVPDFSRAVPTDQQFNAFHWLHGVLEERQTKGRVLAYGPQWGTGAAVIEFRPYGNA